MTDYAKPLPVPSPESEPFWQAAKQHRLAIQKCNECGGTWFPPSSVCRHCGARNARWIDATGRGKVHSFVTFHRLYHPGWEGELPYVVAVVELEEGARMLANIVGIDPVEIVCDMPVEVMFDDVTADVTIPKFQPA